MCYVDAFVAYLSKPKFICYDACRKAKGPTRVLVVYSISDNGDSGLVAPSLFVLIAIYDSTKAWLNLKGCWFPAGLVQFTTDWFWFPQQTPYRLYRNLTLDRLDPPFAVQSRDILRTWWKIIWKEPIWNNSRVQKHDIFVDDFVPFL